MNEIIKHEFRKAAVSPIIIMLTLLFIGYNLFIIFDQLPIRIEISIINQLFEKHGTKIDLKTINSISDDYTSELEKMNNMLNDKISKTYWTAEEFFNDISYDKHQIFTQKEMQIATSVLVLEIYHNELQQYENHYDTLDLEKSVDNEIKNYDLSGDAAETVRKTFQKLEVRMDRMLKNNEHKTLFFLGKQYKLHSFLFGTLLSSIIIESMILTVLITSFINTYEFENKTQGTVYVSKRGRNLVLDKLIASIGASVFVTTFILLVTMICYFLIFDYSLLWNVPISSYFNAEFDFPIISWWKLSFGQYFVLCILVLFICQIIFSSITFVITSFIRNSYFSFVLFLLLWGLGKLFPTFFSGDSNMIFTSRLTPFTLISKPEFWFIGGGAFQTKYFEFTTMIIWVILLLILVGISIRKFKGQDIY